MYERKANKYSCALLYNRSVPERFFDELIGGRRFLRISKIRNSRVLQIVIRMFSGSFVQWVVGLFSQPFAKKLRRLHGLIKYALDKSQNDRINILNRDYTKEFPYVLLSMDMEYMDADDPYERFPVQLEKLQAIKADAKYRDKIFPFIFADPRPKNVASIVKQYLTDKSSPFQGIKLYPALGYFPFDKNLKEVYQFAVDYDIPIVTHCIIGDVYKRDPNQWKEIPTHPFLKHPTAPTKEY
jgi:hypothetical protein